jgi:hypothetical protein
MRASVLLYRSLHVFSGLAVFASLLAAQPAPYRMLTTIQVPGNLLGGFDISWADSANARYYLADRGNATATPPLSPRIDVIDTANDVLLGTVTLPAAVNGVLSIPRAHEIWVGDNSSNVQVIDTNSLTITHTISTGGTARADETAYDGVHHLVLIANDRDTPPFVSFISTTTYTVLKKINYDGTNGNPQSTGGIEQPVWDGAANKFYISIPATKANANGEVDELDPVSLSITRTIPSACTGPAGLVLIPGQRLMSSCGDVIDIAGGKVLTTIAGVGGDEIWFNPGDEHVYFGGSAGATNRIGVSVVDANANQLLTTLTVGKIVAAPGVSQTTHSVAADGTNNQIFVPVTGVGVEVWSNGPSVVSFTANPNPIPVATGVRYGSTTLSWSAPDAGLVEIHVGSPSGPIFTQQGNTGTAQTGTWVADGTTFYLQDVTGGKALTAANTLAILVVHLKSM